VRTELECIPCLLRQSLEAARFVTEDPAIHELVMRETLRTVADLDFLESPPTIAQVVHRRLRELTGDPDPYRSAKAAANRLVMALLPELAADVERAPDPLLAAVRLAIAGNVIDLAITADLTEAVTCRALQDASREPFHGEWTEFRRALADATDILYLADNAGEIVTDRLLIEQIGPARVTMAVRGHAVINDATLADARDVGLCELVEVVSNGSDAPGTILDDCDASFRERFRNADLLIAKGQGNFETLSHAEDDEDTKDGVFFLFKVKCPVVAGQVNLPVGSQALVQAHPTRPVLDPGTA